MGRLRGLAWKRVARGVIGAVVGNIASAATLHIPRRAVRLSSDRLLAIVACGRPLRLQLGEDGNERIGDQLKHGHRVIFQCDVCAFLSGGASEQLADCPDGSCVVVDHSQKPPTPVFRGSRVSAAASMLRPPANLHRSPPPCGAHRSPQRRRSRVGCVAAEPQTPASLTVERATCLEANSRASIWQIAREAISPARRLEREPGYELLVGRWSEPTASALGALAEPWSLNAGWCDDLVTSFEALA